MERRTAIKNLLILAGGVVFIPSCMQQSSEASIALKHLKINGSDEKLLAEIAETILPASQTPGAKDTYAHLFALKMVDDCYEKEVQQKFTKGLKEVDDYAKKQFNKSFMACNPDQRNAIVGTLEKEKEADTDRASFYKTLKSLTIQGFLSSQYVLTNILKYELVPGRYNGFAPVIKKQNAA